MFTRRDVFYSLPVKYLIRRSIWIYICTIKFNKKFKLFDLTSLKIFFLLPFLSEPIYSLMLPSLFFIHRIISGYERYKSSLITNLIWCHPWNNIFRRTKKFSKFCYAQITCHFVSSSWWGCITWFKGPCCHLKRDHARFTQYPLTLFRAKIIEISLIFQRKLIISERGYSVKMICIVNQALKTSMNILLWTFCFYKL